MKKIIVSFAAFLILFLALFTTIFNGDKAISSSDEMIFSNDDDKKIRVVFTNWKPYGYMDNAKAAGFELEVFSAVMNKMGIQPEFDEYPWKRCLHMVRKGTADVIISALKTPEREEFLNFPSEPISQSNSAFFTTTDKNISFNGSYEDLTKYTIGVISGFSYGPSFDSADFLSKDKANNTEQVVKKLVKGRYEIAIGNTAVISVTAKNLGVRSDIRFLTPLVHSEKLYVGFSKAGNHAELSDAFSKSISEFTTTAEYKEIMVRYGFIAMENHKNIE